MTVETYSNRPPVQMTQAALDHVRGQMSKNNAAALRFGVNKSGCSGYMYVLDFVDEAQQQDAQASQAFEVGDGVTIYIDSQLLPILHGTRIDYVTEGLNACMKFENPNAQGECGCGESFTV